MFFPKNGLDNNPISDYNKSEIGLKERDELKTKVGRELREFNALYNEVDGLYHQIALKTGLSDSGFSIMYSLVEFGDGCLQKDIADYYFISRKTINSSIKKLEAQGYIRLEKGKRRDMHLYLTEAGKKFVDEEILPVFEIENTVLTEFSAEEYRQLLSLMRKYVALCREKIEKEYGLSSEDL